MKSDKVFGAIMKHRKNWKAICIIAGIVAIAFAKIGYDKAMEGRVLSDNQQYTIDRYQAVLKQYEYVLADIDETISLTEQQIIKQKNYIDNSIYMKLDSTKIRTASAQYSIQNATNQGNVLGALVSRVNDGYILGYLADEMEMESGYLKELISCSTNTNLFIMNVSYTDMETAKSILKLMEDAMIGQVQNIREKQGDFEFVLLDETFQTRNDTAVLNGQNTNNTALKNLLVTKSDLEKKKADQIANLSKYIENYRPDALEIKQISVVGWVLRYVLAGVVFSLVLFTGILLLREVVRSRINGAEDIIGAEIPFLGESSILDMDTVLSRISFLISIRLKKSQSEQVLLCNLTQGKHVLDVLEILGKKLKTDGLTVRNDKANLESLDFLRNLVKAGNCVLLVQRGKTTLEELKAHKNLCDELGVKICGCVIVD